MRAWQFTPVFLPGESYGREPSGLQSMGSQRVRHDWSDLAHSHRVWGSVEWGSDCVLTGDVYSAWRSMTFSPLCRCEQWWAAAWHGLLYNVFSTAEESRGGVQREQSFIDLPLCSWPITKWSGVWLCHQRDLTLNSKPKCAHSKVGIMVAPYPVNTSSVLSKHHYKIDNHQQVFLNIMWVESHALHTVCAKLLQSCPVLCNPTDHSPPSSSVHGTLQARILEWVAIALLEGIFWIQRLNLCPFHLLHWQAGSWPLAPPGKSAPHFTDR